VGKAVCAFTVDVEGFAESHAQSVHVPKTYLSIESTDREIEENLAVTIDLLAEFDVKATFFFLGRIAQTASRLVRRVADTGHEIGCHSLNHLRITGQTRGEFRRDLRSAKAALEDASGTAVSGFRAPDFSIGNENTWAFDEIQDAGFLYDSSVVPTFIHDVYGMRDVSERIFQWPNGLIEFPMPVVRILGLRIPCGGGGYFRLFPGSWTRRLFAARNRRNIPTTFYIHPYEIGPVAPTLPGLPLARRFRHYVHLHKGAQRIAPLLKAVPFTTISQVLTSVGYLVANDGRASAS
jgi:polysaccharide deacetylase family protein (PEP-CTERM system associated)